MIIDHHPRRKNLQSAVTVIDNEIGATATLLVEWLVEAQCEIHSGIATSLTYAIRSETQDLGREVSERDVQAYLRVLPKSTMRKLAKIILPKLPNTYFIQLNDTLKTARIFRNLIFAYLGTIPYPEIVAEMADLLLKHERISWSFCAGQYGNELHLSLRSSNAKANAGKLIKKLVSDKNAAGGHDTFAGGKIIINGNDALENLDIAEKLSKKFASLMGYPGAEWRLLTES